MLGLDLLSKVVYEDLELLSVSTLAYLKVRVSVPQAGSNCPIDSPALSSSLRCRDNELLLPNHDY